VKEKKEKKAKDGASKKRTSKMESTTSF
jgi:hypothetical protein